MKSKFQWKAVSPSGNPCFCVGPQNGEPLCPCKMERVIIKNGRYVLKEQDLGPVIKSGLTSDDR